MSDEEAKLRMALELSKRTEEEWGRIAANYAIKAEADEALVSMWRSRHDRLSKLIKQAESVDGECPWCRAKVLGAETAEDKPHAIDCPAFMPDGSVR